MPLLTVGHGPEDRDRLGARLAGAGVASLVDIRRFPGSRNNPDVGREALAEWLPDRRHRLPLGGAARRTAAAPAGEPVADGWWTVAQFAAYAAHTRTPEFTAALDEVLAEADAATVAVMCSESVWWRCHRRLVADVAVLGRGVPVDAPDARRPADRRTGRRRARCSATTARCAGRRSDYGPAMTSPDRRRRHGGVRVGEDDASPSSSPAGSAGSSPRATTTTRRQRREDARRHPAGRRRPGALAARPGRLDRRARAGRHLVRAHLLGAQAQLPRPAPRGQRVGVLRPRRGARRPVLAERVDRRTGHYMPPSLLDQPAGHPRAARRTTSPGITVPGTGEPTGVVDAIVAALPPRDHGARRPPPM